MNVLYKPNIGGIENSISEISKVFIRQGYEVDILCSDRNNEDDSHLDLFCGIDGATIYRYEYAYKGLSFIKNVLNSRKSIRKLTNKNDYSFVISRNYFLVIVAAMSGLKNIKYIPPEVSYYSKMGEQTKLTFHKLVSDSVKFSLQWSALMIAKDVIVLSESMFDQVKRISLGMVLPRIANPGVNLQRFSIASLEEKKRLKNLYDIPQNKKILLALGRYSDVKQFDLAIMAMTKLPSDMLLIVVGSGPELKKYQDIVIKNNLKDKVVLLNSTTSPESFYKIADVFLMTSRYESFGQTILEACVSGVQIVGFSKKSGANTNIESMLSECKGVYFVDEQSSVALARAVEKSFLDNQSLHAIFSHNQKILKRKYSWTKFVSVI
ncbi:glycosyltransferase [Psychrobacter submarinus]|uniref:glycosyltransferase n=1 Tax=Psychrobacter submarinus TaxID=154108 RepID=UPI00191B8A75|nr:glycosyltransferase [Psychrobacter submarinus]